MDSIEYTAALLQAHSVEEFLDVTLDGLDGVRIGTDRTMTVFNRANPLARIEPDGDTTFTLPELQEAVGGYFEFLTLAPGYVLVMNEEGAWPGNLPPNVVASALAGRPIVGNVAIIRKALA